METNTENKFLKLQLLKNTTNRPATSSSSVHASEDLEKPRRCSTGLSPGPETGTNATRFDLERMNLPISFACFKTHEPIRSSFHGSQKIQPLNNVTEPKIFLTLHFPVFVTSSGAAVASQSPAKQQQPEINWVWMLFRPRRQG